MSSLRVASLLPSATEIIGRLGLAKHLVCVSHECDEPADALPELLASGNTVRVTSSAIDPEALSQAAIDESVKSSLQEGHGLYGIDSVAVARQKPNVLFTQSICNVCAPHAQQVHNLKCELVSDPAESGLDVISLEPSCVRDVATSFCEVAAACGVLSKGEELQHQFLTDLREISAAVSQHVPQGVEKPKVFVLEWLSPPFNAGHWVPELVQIALGDVASTSASATGPSGDSGATDWHASRSVQVSWDEVSALDPDVLVASCCGFDLGRNLRDAAAVLSSHPKAAQLRAVRSGRVFAVDGNRYLARPGPSLVQGAAAVAAAVWCDHSVVYQALLSTGLVPEKGRMWGKVELQDAPTPNSPSMAVAHSVSSEEGGKQPARTASASAAVLAGAADIEELPVCPVPAATWKQLHDAAVARGEKFYTDPTTELMVMTELIHRARGRCCGSGCRHCPYHHEGIKPEMRAAKIAQPAWLCPPTPATAKHATQLLKSEAAVAAEPPENGADGSTCEADSNPGASLVHPGCIVLFWSTGKDSFLAFKALSRCAAGKPENETEQALGIQPGTAIVLLTTFDATSRHIAHQETHVADAMRQADALGVPLLGVPLQRGGPEYKDTVQAALEVVRQAYPDGPLALAFGDLHLEHVRQWRQHAGIHTEAAGERLLFPLWGRQYEELVQELEGSGVPCVVSAVCEEARSAVAVGETFDRCLFERVQKVGVDGFGENGEFHTLAQVWLAAPDRGTILARS